MFLNVNESVEIHESSPGLYFYKRITQEYNPTISAVKNAISNNFPEKKEIEVSYSKNDDNRSYHINSDKIEKILGFRAKRTVEDAVQELCDAFKNNLLPNSLTDNKYFNVRTLKDLAIK